MQKTTNGQQAPAGDDTRLAVQTIRGILWSGVGQVGIQGFGFFVSMVLARLLSPREYGLFAATALFTGLLGAFSGSALTAALVQRTDVTEEDLDTSFWMAMALGGAMALLLIVFARPIATFFREPLIAPLVMVQALGMALTPLGAVHTALLSRRMDFRSLAMVDLTTVAGSGVLAIGMALSGWGVWSLVVPGVAGTSLGVFVLWQRVSWRVRGGIARNSLAGVGRFSLSMLAFNVLNYVRGNVDYLVLGRALGARPLGLYYLAYNITTIPQTRLAPIITRVLFPALSAVQHDLPRLRSTYVQAVRYVALVTFPLLTGLAILAPEFVLAVFGAQWAEAAPLVRILCLAGVLYSVGTTTGSVIFSRGRADLACWISIGAAAAMTGCVLAGARYGALGVAAGVAAYATLSFIPVQLLTNRLIDLSPADFLRALVPATIGCAAMAIVLLFGRAAWEIWRGTSPVAGVVVLVSAGAATYLGTLWIAHQDVLRQVAAMLRQALGSRPITSER
jgi:O-antigen/teichoic acid export membrane protein